MIAKKDITKMINSLKMFDARTTDFIGSMIWGFQRAKKLRISSISSALPGNYESNYKSIMRALKRLDSYQLLEGLLAFLDSASNILLLDFTEMVRKSAERTNYVGYLQDGETLGYSILALSVPFKGRSKVVFADIISSSIIANSETGKWKLIQEALRPLIPVLQNKTVVIDREFCNEEMINFFLTHRIHFVIRLKVSAGKHEIKITDKRGRRINISITQGSKKNWKGVYYKGKVKVNIAVEWQFNMSEPLYVITDCEPLTGLKYYKMRMKIEESFKDVKDKLGFTKVMNKTLANLLKMLLIGLIAYNLLILIGEMLRDKVLTARERLKYSGLHLLLNMIYSYSRSRLRKTLRQVALYLLANNSDDVVWLRAFRSC
jgi:hypothetical protein